VQRGDSLFLIGRRFGVSVHELLQANPQIKDPDRIFVGQVICIPRVAGEPPEDQAGQSPAVEAAAGDHIPPPPPTCSGFYYTVRRGDSLFLIGRRFGVTVAELLQANPQIKNANLIFVGQVICIPHPGRGPALGSADGHGTAVEAGPAQPIPPPPPTCSGFYYTVQRGDSLFLIGRRFGVTVQQLLQANPQITNPNLIYVGQVICIPRAGVGEPEAPGGNIEITIRIPCRCC
jgi:LysM repeat protein